MNHSPNQAPCAACGGTGRTEYVKLGRLRDRRGVPHPAGCIGRLRCPECNASSPEDAAELRKMIATIDRNYDEWGAVDPETLEEQICEGCGDHLVTKPQTLCPNCERPATERRANRVRQEEADSKKWCAQVSELQGQRASPTARRNGTGHRGRARSSSLRAFPLTANGKSSYLLRQSGARTEWRERRGLNPRPSA
jgi:hypothetical protein